MKKILIFSTAYFPLVGGAEVAVKEITDRIKGFEFDMITAKIKPDLANQERIGNINIYRVGSGSSFDKYRLPFLGLKKAIQLEKENNYKLTWSIMASFGGFLGLRFKKKFPNKPWLLTLQEGDPPEEILKKVGIFKFWFRQIFERANYIQAISIFLLNWSKKMGAKSPGEIVPNGVDLDIFRPDTKVRPLQRSDLKFRILTVSRLVKKNGVDDLIKAGQYLDFPFKIVIVGDGPDEEKLKKLAKEKKIEDKIIFKGEVNHHNLVKYYSSADIFVRPSLSEGLGNSFLEAMAMGLPIIGTSVGGIPDFLEDKKTGLFCEVKNPKSIAQKIKEILEDNDLKKSLIYNGLELIREKYTWDVIVPKMENIFKKL